MCEECFYYKDSDFSELLSGSFDTDHKVLIEGLQNGVCVDISYEDRLGDMVERRIFPEVLYPWNDEWYIAAYCHLREEERTFRLDRILSAELTDIKEESHGIAEAYRKEGIPWLREDVCGEDDSDEIDLEIEEADPGYRKISDQEREQRALNLDLIRYTEQNRIDLIDQVLEVGADIHCKDHAGNPLLFSAVKNGNLNVLKHLISRGADITEKNGAKDSLLFCAAWNSQDGILPYLVEELCCDPNEKNIHGWSPLTAAVWNFNCRMVQYLLNHGSDINISDEEGKSLLMFVAETHGSPMRKFVMFRFLVEHGADLSFRDKQGRNILFYLAESTNPEMFQFVLDRQVLSVDVRDNHGSSLLLSALQHFNDVRFLQFDRQDEYPEHVQEMIRLLCDSGVDLNIGDKNGITPLMIAKGKTFEYLLDRGADPHARALNGRTVAMFRAGNLAHIDLLAAAGVDLKLRDNNGNDVLMSAPADLEHIRYFVEKHGFSVNDRNRKQTLLHNAADFLDPDAVQYLLEHGADTEALNSNERTAFAQFMHDHDYPWTDIDCKGIIYDMLSLFNQEFFPVFSACRTVNPEKLRNIEPEKLSQYIDEVYGWDNMTLLKVTEREWAISKGAIPDENAEAVFDLLIAAGANPADDPNGDGHSLIVTCLEMNRESLAEKYLNLWMNGQENAIESLKKLYEWYRSNPVKQDYFPLAEDFFRKKLGQTDQAAVSMRTKKRRRNSHSAAKPE